MNLKVFTVRIDYDDGMERLDVAAMDRHSCFNHAIRLLKLKERCRGVSRKLVSIAIERE